MPPWTRAMISSTAERICLVLTAPALLAYVEHYRSGIEKQVIACPAAQLGLDPHHATSPNRSHTRDGDLNVYP